MLEWNLVEEWLSWTLVLWKWDVKVTCPARKSTLLYSDKQTNFIQAMHIKEIIDAQSALLHCKHTWQRTVRTRSTKQKLKKTEIPACPSGYLHACLPLWFSWMKTFLGLAHRASECEKLLSSGQIFFSWTTTLSFLEPCKEVYFLLYYTWTLICIVLTV